VLVEMGLAAYVQQYKPNERLTGAVVIVGTVAAIGAIVWLVSLQRAITWVRELNWRIRESFTKGAQDIIGPINRKKLRLVWWFYGVVGAAWFLMVVALANVR
jgi:hypothetical protein